MTKPNYQKATFLLSVARLNQLPPDFGIEVAFVGRSNAGKSSVLNTVTQNKSLARVSKTPGRTQHINLFGLDTNRRMADLPGYGFAKVPLAAKLKWQKLVDTYIRTRESLKGLILVMDIRHPFKDLDLQLLEYCDDRMLPVHILLSKADKLSRGAVSALFPEIEEVLSQFKNPISFQAFSALKGMGVLELQGLLDEWYQW